MKRGSWQVAGAVFAAELLPWCWFYHLFFLPQGTHSFQAPLVQVTLGFESECPRGCAGWQGAELPIKAGGPGLPGVAPWSLRQLGTHMADTKFLACLLQN